MPMFDQNQALNAQQTQDPELLRKQALAKGLMQQATNPGAATGNAGTANMISSALSGALAGYMQRRPGTPSGITSSTPMDYSSGMYGTPQAGV